MSDILPEILFTSKAEFHAWLEKHGGDSNGIWLKISKKGSGVRSISYSEAVEEALCYGWIDSQKKPFDRSIWLQKFSPRKKSSIWSRINKEKAIALMGEGKMQASGMAAIEEAKESGKWEAAYESQKTIRIPVEFKTMLDRNPEALAFFRSLDSINKYAILFRIQKQKTEKNQIKKMNEFLAMLLEGKKIYP